MKYNHSTGTFIGKGGAEIFYQEWLSNSPKGVLVFAHGVGEHSGRYANILHELDGKKYSIYALDHRGHGKSGGKRGHVDSFLDFVYDLKFFIDRIREDTGRLPLILLGHSMGGAIAMRYALTYPDDLTALILSSPGLIFAVKTPKIKIALARFLSKILPKLAFPTGIDARGLSHDKKVVEEYINDPLVHDLMSAKLFVEFTSNNEDCLARAKELNLPVFIFHGKADPIVDCRSSEIVYDRVSSKIKELHIFENLHHETMNETEPERKKVFSLLTKWIDRMMAPAVKKTAPAGKKK